MKRSGFEFKIYVLQNIRIVIVTQRDTFSNRIKPASTFHDAAIHIPSA